MYVGLADPMGQLVGTENNKKLDVSVKSLIVNGSNSKLYQPTIAGTTSFYSRNGVYILQDIIFTGAPGSGYGLSVVSDGIDDTKPANVEYLKKLSQKKTLKLQSLAETDSASDDSAVIEFEL